MQFLRSIAFLLPLWLANGAGAFPAKGIGDFATPEAACAAWARPTKGPVTTRDTGDGHVGCTVTDKETDQVFSQESIGQVNCPANARAINIRSCECNAGYVYQSNACVDSTVASPAGDAANASAAATSAGTSAAAQDCAAPGGKDKPKSQRERDTVRRALMPPHHAACFSTDSFPQPSQKKEFAVQLARQQDALNRMTLDEFIGGMTAYAFLRQDGPRETRKGHEARQKQARMAYRQQIESSMRRSMACQGMQARKIDAQIDAKVNEVMGRLHALHEPDINVAGGDVTRLGPKGINSSIGQQWVGVPGRRTDDARRYLLLKAAQEAKNKLGGEALINVVLEPCRR